MADDVQNQETEPEEDPFNRPKLNLPADEVARLEREKASMLIGRERTPLPDEIGGPRASRVRPGERNYPDQREPEPLGYMRVGEPSTVRDMRGPVEEPGRPRYPVTVEIAGSNPAGTATLAALSAIIRNPALAKMTMKQYRTMLLAVLGGR